MRCKREKILLPSNSRKHADFDLLIEQPITGMKCKNNAYRKVNGGSAKHSRCNTPAYAHPPLKTHKLTPENLLNADIKETPVRPLQSAGNTSTTAFPEFTLKPISAEPCKKLPERTLSRQPSAHWRPAHVERAPHKKTRNCKAKNSAPHCSSRRESTPPKPAQGHCDKSSRMCIAEAPRPHRRGPQNHRRTAGAPVFP